MFNLSAEQINECRLILQSINAKAVDMKKAIHDREVAEYQRKAAEQAERKAAAKREAYERDRKIWPVENGRMRVPPKAYGPSKVTVVRDRRGQCAGFKEDESVLRDRPTLADPRLGESTRDPNRTHQGRPGAPTKPYPYKQDLKPAPDKGEEAQFACEVAPTAFAWIAGACFLVAGLAHLTTTPTTNQFDPLFDVDKYDRPRTSGD